MLIFCLPHEFTQLVKQFVELSLNSSDSVLTEQVEQLIIGDEVQTREGCSLFIKVFLDFFLNGLEPGVPEEEFVKVAVLEAVSLYLLSLDFFHLGEVLLFDCDEFTHLTLELMCFFDVLDVENVLKVQPGTLEDLPLLYCV